MDPSPQPVEYGTIQSYLLGFAFSLLLTLGAYYAKNDALIALLAIGQAVVQLLLFFNLGKGAKPRWNLLIFLFMLMVVVIVVVGSIWIMNNLNYNLMQP